MAENKKYDFPTEVITLPSQGLGYDEKSPLSKGEIEIKYMTAKEEDILTSQNLIKKGMVIEKLLDSLILTKGVKVDNLGYVFGLFQYVFGFVVHLGDVGLRCAFDFPPIGFWFVLAQNGSAGVGRDASSLSLIHI